MGERKSDKGSFDPDGFIKRLSQLLETLPSVEEQQKSVAALDAMIRYLTDVKNGLTSVPTQHDLQSTKLAVAQLSALFVKARSNPVLAAAIGLRSQAPRSTTPVPSNEDIESARRAIAQFDKLPIDELRSALSNKSLGELKVLAKELGIRSTQRTSHEALAHHIATRITNTRGYRSLRDGDQSRDA